MLIQMPGKKLPEFPEFFQSQFFDFFSENFWKESIDSNPEKFGRIRSRLTVVVSLIGLQWQTIVEIWAVKTGWSTSCPLEKHCSTNLYKSFHREQKV